MRVGLVLFAVRRADIEWLARDLEARSPARATVARRLCTVGFFRRPDRNGFGALVAAGLASARQHALVSLLSINGLRVSEALGSVIEPLGIERGHRTLTAAQGRQDRHDPLAPC